MRRRVSVRTGPLSLNTRETVATETSASRATSLIVALIRELLPAAETGTSARPRCIALRQSSLDCRCNRLHCRYRTDPGGGLSSGCHPAAILTFSLYARG